MTAVSCAMPKFSWADQEHAERMKAWFLELPHVVGLAPLSLFRPSSSSIVYALQRGQRSVLQPCLHRLTVKVLKTLMRLMFRLGYNHQYVGSTQLAPPLPSTAFACKPKKLRPGWRIDHVRKKVSSALDLIRRPHSPKYCMQPILPRYGNALTWS